MNNTIEVSNFTNKEQSLLVEEKLKDIRVELSF